jgi:HlyD family secretion protein
MILKYIIPLLALGMLAFGVTHVITSRDIWTKDQPPLAPPRSPFPSAVAGAGVVEAQTENISVGTPVPGVVVEVQVRVGQRVSAGQPLFRLDDRQSQAELKVQEAALAAARAELERLAQQPRQEELPIKEAAVREAEANFAMQEYELQRVQALRATGAAQDVEMQRIARAHSAAEAQLARVRAELALIRAGSWEFDRSVAQTGVAQAESRVAQVRTELDRLVVRALVDGDVLQVNVRPGEYVGTPAGQPLVVLGNVRQLHVRVDIDEHDIPRFHKGAPAKAMLKGSPREEFALQFVRVEPFVIPKRSLTGDVVERVDTRVLQVIYAIDPRGQELYVGQQLDVFIAVDAPAEPTSRP